MVKTYLSRDEKTIFFDTETTGLDPQQDKLVSMQFKQRGHPSILVDVRQMNLDLVAEILAPLFAFSYLFVGHHLRFDLSFMLAYLGVRLYKACDTMIAEQVLHGLGQSSARNQGVPMTLAATVKRHLGLDLPKEERNWFIGLDKRPEEWNAPLPEEQIAYALRDVDVLEELLPNQLNLLRERDLIHVFKLESRVLPAIVAMEHAGMRIDVEGWRRVIAEKDAEARSLEEEVLKALGPAILMHRAEVWKQKQAEYDAWEVGRNEQERWAKECWEFQKTGEPWGKFKLRVMQEWREKHPNPGKPKPDTSVPNIGSTRQLVAAFEVLKIPVPRKRRDNGSFTPSLDSDALKPLRDSYPEVKTLLAWRGAQKFVDSFGESLLAQVSSVDSRIHPEVQQIGADTGRESFTNPNLQQIPAKGDGKKLRACIVAAPGNKLLVADYSGIEMRILADQSKDPTLCGVFERGEDIHSATARMMFDLDETVDVAETLIPGSNVTYRAAAKQLNYMLMYGGGAKKLARILGCTLALAEELMGRYFALYAGVDRYLENLKKLALRSSMTVTASGRKRYFHIPLEPMFPFAEKGNPGRIAEWRAAHKEWEFARSRIERQGMNTPIQGTSADITKLAHALFYERMILPDPRLAGCPQVIAVVHDEMVVECAEEEADECAEALADAMDDAQQFYLTHVTLVRPEVHISDHWAK